MSINTVRFYRSICLVFAACVFGSIASVFAQMSTTDVSTSGWSTIAYRGIPIELEIKAGEESILQFPWRVEMGTSSEMLDMVKLEPIGDSVFLTPRSDFDKTRFYAEAVDSGAMFQIDIVSSNDGRPRMVRFLDGRGQDAPPERVEVQRHTTTPDSVEELGGYSWATVARFALQNIYSPERLIEPLQNMNEIKTDTTSVIADLVPGAEITARPWAQWQTIDGMYVIAVELQNQSHYGVTINPTKLRHSLVWKASAYWANYVYPAGELGDRTTMVIITPDSWENTTQSRGLN